MRAVLGVLGLLLAMGMVVVLAKQQLGPSRQAVPVVQPAQQIPQQYKQALEGALQQARPVEDDK
jgi:hypothetical protein